MTYIKVFWNQDNPNYPVWLYSELDSGRWETRKVEKYFDGSFGFAGQHGSHRDTKLSIEPLPPIEKIAANTEFEVTVIDEKEFQDVWLASQ